MTAIEASRNITRLTEVLLKMPTKKESENIAGIVEIPNINITAAPQKALAVLAAVMAKK